MRNKLSEKFELFVINLESGDLIENFFLTSIATILGIRAFLYLTGYPTVGGETYHIAHMLWGGLLMLIALLIFMGFLSREARETASVIAGIGFGFFIDELGKFITTDNNYFFEPTIMLIYCIFIALFLIVRLAEQLIKVNKKTYAINGLEMTKEALLFDLDSQEKKRALAYLRKAQKDNEFIQGLIALLENVQPHTLGERNFFGKIKDNFETWYLKTASNKSFAIILTLLFIGVPLLHYVPILTGGTPLNTISGYGVFISTTLSMILVVLGGLLFLRGSRHLGLELFKYSALVSIFITQFFLFYTDQLSAVFYLFISLTMYITTRIFLAQESAGDDSIKERVKSLTEVFK